MTLKLVNTALLSFLTCCLLCPSANAGQNALIPTWLEQSKDICAAPNKQSHLASAYEEHLKQKGQDSSVIGSLYNASVKSGVDMELLLLKAILESDLGRYIEAKRSSARGLFQYIEPTWLILIKRYGAQIGYPEYASAIKIGKRTGIPYFKGPAKYLRPEILALRYDPDASAMIKAYQIKEETQTIRSYKRSKRVTTTDHYIAHMMGLSLARDFYDLKNKNSIIAVARLNRPEMREAAKLNRIFFYDKKRPLTAPEAYKKFDARVKREIKRIRYVAKSNPAKNCTKSASLNAKGAQ